MQTILGTFFGGPPLTHGTVERQLTLPDGDRLMLYDSIPTHWRPGRPCAVLVHGLGGNHRSSYVQRLGRALLRRGWRIVRADLRGCGKGVPLARKPYHAGSSDDVRAVLAFVHEQTPTSPLALAGFSLGGNIVLKLAGEAAGQPVAGLTRVAAVNPPIDLLRASNELGFAHNRFYERHFLRELIALVRRRTRHFPDHATRFPRGLSLRQFDDMYIAPRCGFADALDYYTRSSSKPLIARIELPTLILTAADDPLIPVDSFHELAAPEHVEVRIAAAGGHLGFLGWDGAGGVRWAERRVFDWLVES